MYDSNVHKCKYTFYLKKKNLHIHFLSINKPLHSLKLLLFNFNKISDELNQEVTILQINVSILLKIQRSRFDSVPLWDLNLDLDNFTFLYSLDIVTALSCLIQPPAIILGIN